ncbi:MAG: ABC transporter permease [Candidatus Thorarchaeota archaeon]
MALIADWKEDYYDIWLNIRFEFIKNWKAKRTLIAAGISLVLSAMFYFIISLSGSEFPTESNEFLATSMGFVQFLLMLNAVLFGADSLNSEHHKKTALLVYPLPQRRSVIVFGKFIVQLISSWGVILIYYGITAMEVSVIYGWDHLTLDLIKSYLFSCLYMSALLAVAFFLSALMENPAVSMALTFFLLFLFFPVLNAVFNLIDFDTSWIFTNYSKFIMDVFRFPAESFGPSARFRSAEDLDFYKGVWICLMNVFGFFIGSWILTLRREA